MKKALFALLVVAAVAIAAPRSASAQTAPTLVKVPFQFIVGETVLPAGSYRIASQDSSALLITSLKGKPVAAFASTVRTENPTPTNPHVHVAFKNIDGQYFLWQVSMPGSDSREVIVTRAQAKRTLAKLNLGRAEHADVAK